MLRITHLEKSFGKKQILDDISLELDKKVYGLLGPNGAGKTTLLRCITSLYRIKKNTVTFDGCDISNGEGGVNIGYLPQKFGLFRDLTAADALMFIAGIKGIDKKYAREEVQRVLDLANLTDKSDTKIRKLSGGMVRRLGIAQAFMGDPEIMIFDEPTAGLDPEERMRFNYLISNETQGKTVIISTHIVSDVETACTDALIIDRGKIIITDSVSSIKQKANGKVYTVPKEETTEDMITVSAFERDNVHYCRVVSGKPLPYEKQMPTLEDGYVYWLKNHEN